MSKKCDDWKMNRKCRTAAVLRNVTIAADCSWQRSAALAAMLLSVMGNASAQDVPQWYINPALGWQQFDDVRQLDADGSSMLFGLERRLSYDWAIELQFAAAAVQDTLQPEQSGSFWRNSLNTLYYLGDGVGWEPYLSAGAGLSRLHMDAGFVENDWYLSGAAGIRYVINPTWSVRAEARYFHSLDEPHGDHLLSLGVSYSFGRISPPVATKPVIVAARSESSVEQLPYVAVESTDKIAETTDSQPVTPDAAEWKVYFAFNSSDITADHHEALSAVADLLKTQPNTTALIEGHTDSVGSSGYNEVLAVKRALAVAAVLSEQHDVSLNQLAVSGKGELQPQADNSIAEGRRRNRRVVISLKKVI